MSRCTDSDPGCHARPVTLDWVLLQFQVTQGGPRVGPRSSGARSCIGLKRTQGSAPRRRPKLPATGLDTRLSKVRSLAQAVIDLHGCCSPFSLLQNRDCTVWHKRWQVCHDIATLASAEGELAEVAARTVSRTQWSVDRQSG